VHEYSIVEALLEQVEAEAEAHRATSVQRIHLSIGELSGVDPELLRLAFDTFRARSMCEGAELSIRMLPARWVCSGCGRAFERGAILRCAICSQPGKLSQGEEIVLDRLEMEASDV
jgi:hydrogenase nickel incorporation protein HypA/HybF